MSVTETWTGHTPWGVGSTQVTAQAHDQSRPQVKKTLARTSPTYSKYYAWRIPRKTAPIYSYWKRQLFLADLAEMKFNPHPPYTQMLVVQDHFTKMAWCLPLITKGAREVTDKFNHLFDILKKGGPLPDRLWTDRGTEFTNQTLAASMRGHGVFHYFTFNDSKVSPVERLIRTLKTLLARLAHSSGQTWVQVLPQAMVIYNCRVHTSIQMSPHSAEVEANQGALRRIYHRAWASFKHQKPKYQVNETVRLAYLRTPFTRGYQQSFTEELFLIVQVKTGPLPMVRYKVQSFPRGEEIIGLLFQHEMTPASPREFSVNGRPIHQVLASREDSLQLRLEQEPDPVWVQRTDIIPPPPPP